MLLMMTSLAEHAAKESYVLEALLARIAQGDKDALGELYDRTHSQVYGFAMSLSHCPVDAEDVLQETYINVFSASESYTPHGKPMAWIMTIAKNLARMRLREVKRSCDMPDEDWSGYLADNPAVSSDERSRSVHLVEVSDVLRNPDKSCVIVKFLLNSFFCKDCCH